MSKPQHEETKPDPKDAEVLKKIFESYPGTVYAVIAYVGEDSNVNMVQGGNKNIKLPTTETVKALSFGQVVALGVQDLLAGQVMNEVHQLVSNVVDLAGEQLQEE